MPSLSLQNFSLHHIDIVSQNVKKASTKGTANDLNDFINNLLDELLNDDKGGEYKFSDVNELVPSMVIKMANNQDWEKCTDSIANKLLKEEIDRQEEVKGIAQLQKGSLLQVKGIMDGSPIVVVMKIEHDEYVDEEELNYHFGLPTNKRRLQKSSIIFFDTSLNVERILKSGNPKIAEYWWKRFFACEPLTNSATNTSKAYSAIDIFLRKEIKKTSSADYYFMRNEVNFYFKSSDHFVFDDIVSQLEKYTPDDDELKGKYSKIISNLKKLPKSVATSKKFDTQFDIDFSAIKSKVNKKIVLAENFELNLKGNIDDFKKIVTRGKDGERKYIKIFSDVGYDEFS